MTRKKEKNKVGIAEDPEEGYFGMKLGVQKESYRRNKKTMLRRIGKAISNIEK